MTPKEKAVELVNKLYNTIYLDLDYEQSKYAALIAVDEIFYALSFNSDIEISEDYWQKVKQEIANL